MDSYSRGTTSYCFHLRELNYCTMLHVELQSVVQYCRAQYLSHDTMSASISGLQEHSILLHRQACIASLPPAMNNMMSHPNLDRENLLYILNDDSTRLSCSCSHDFARLIKHDKVTMLEKAKNPLSYSVFRVAQCIICFFQQS